MRDECADVASRQRGEIALRASARIAVMLHVGGWSGAWRERLNSGTMASRMRIASRHMPKYTPKPVGTGPWALLAVVVAGLLYAAASAPIGAAVVGLVVCVGFLLANRAVRREEEQLRHLAAAREGESICEFAREFDTRDVDTWVIRAVYEQVQWQLEHIHAAFPLRASDRLEDDLHLDEDDLDLDLAVQIEQRTGRSLDGSSSNPYFGKVRTVGDLVLFFQSQPRRTAA